MTELKIKKIKNKGFCIVDNCNAKAGRYYSIIVSNLSLQEANKYMNIKGVK